jgi:rfaE bifunctional protein nucleotidyltransferase chain/domain
MIWEKQSQKKLLSPKEDLEKKVNELRISKKTIATINGSYDLLHAGHLEILFQASLQADILIVALNTDSSIKNYKNEKRPIIPLKYRLQMLSAIKFIDYITWFDELDPIKILKVIKPDVHVNGSEYGKNCIEAKTIEECGGRLVLVDIIPGLSTTKIIEKIKQCD